MEPLQPLLPSPIEQEEELPLVKGKSATSFQRPVSENGRFIVKKYFLNYM
jgi:hypothetical protein